MAKSLYVKPTYVTTYTLLLSNIQERPKHNVYIILFIYFKIPTKRNVTELKQQYYYLDIFSMKIKLSYFSQKYSPKKTELYLIVVTWEFSMKDFKVHAEFKRCITVYYYSKCL